MPAVVNAVRIVLETGNLENMENDISRVRRRKMVTKEDELQKKREEAERKARRGEIDPTHEFTFQVIGQVGLINEYQTTS